MPVAGLLARQAWWWSTMVCTAGGLALLFLSEAMLLRALGVAVMALPHVYGAPHPTQLDSAVPAALAAQFATASLATNLVFWIILGVLTAEIMRRAHPDRGEEAATG
jgi:predicted cobalt transporter CbtA